MKNNLDDYKKFLDNITPTNDLKKNTINYIKNKDKKETEFKSRVENIKLSVFRFSTVIATVLIVFSVLIFSDNELKNNGFFGKFLTDNSEFVKENVLGNAEEVLSFEDTIKMKENDVLPKVNNYDKFKNLLFENRNNEGYRITYNAINEASKTLSQDTSIAKFDTNYSMTNVQVEGIDEADIIKTDGNYVFYVANNKVYVLDVRDVNDLECINKIEYDKNFNISEIYLLDYKLVVILNDMGEVLDENSNGKIIYDIAFRNDQRTCVLTYDVSDKSDIKEIRKTTIEGNYISSRLINNEIYVLTNKYFNLNINNVIKSENIDDSNGENIEKNEIYEEVISTEELEKFIPKYSDTIMTPNEEKSIDLDKVLYVPDSTERSFLTITTFSLNDNNSNMNVKAILGAGNEIFCTEKNLYIERVRYEEGEDGGITDIYKFEFEDMAIISKAISSVKGRVINQFCMGEYNNNFVIVTTQEFFKKNRNFERFNMVYMLDENLKEVSKLENIAEGESLKAVRFVGNKVYVVTYKNTDPLFVIELDENNIKILGELEITGYSEYLQLYDENHLFGIGPEVINGKNIGMKLTLFDISDFSNPKVSYSKVFELENAYTEISYNHKVLLFSKEKKILALPVKAYKKPNMSIAEYVVFSIDLEKGINILGEINHGYIENNNLNFNKNMKIIQRGLYIDDNLFTFSSNIVKVHNLENLLEINSLKFDEEEMEIYVVN